jgi:hypothetical protein
MADVVYHEYGHGLQQFIYDPYSPNYSSSGLSEGCSDYWGMTLTNSPCLGNGFFGEGTCLRDGNNTLQYPANSCGGAVHCLGEYIMGATWKMRENLIELHGYENGVAISDDLFYWGQTGRPSSDLDYLYEIYVADDNDGNLQNGTLNYSQICNAFGDHNMSVSGLPDCNAAFADLEFSAPSLDFNLAPGESDSQGITISNVGEEGSIMYFSSGVSPFSVVGDGPDNFGNFWSDSDLDTDIGVEWVDIDGVGALYGFSNNDEAGAQIDIGFDFPFLGGTYSQCIINANGWVGFGEDNSTWDNTNIPSPNAPRSAIFGLWDDLNPENDNCNQYCSGNAYYHGNADRFVVWFNDVAHWYSNFEDSYYNFQIVLYPNGDIDLNYNTLTGSHDATVGMQNADGTDGLQMGLGSNAASNNLSRFVSTGPDWLDLGDNTSGQLGFGEFSAHNFDISSVNLSQGDYNGYIKISSNGGSATFPVSLAVGEGNEIMAGDVNFDSVLNVLDVVILVNFILEVNAPDSDQFAAGDINSDGTLNVLDIVNLVNLILQ